MLRWDAVHFTAAFAAGVLLGAGAVLLVKSRKTDPGSALRRIRAGARNAREEVGEPEG